MSIRFGECRFDPDARRLFRQSREVHLSPKAFELLKILLETQPRAMAKAELLERVWPGVFVSDASLASVINQLRNAVGDSARRGAVIRTVHAYGYAFVAEVSAEPSEPASLHASQHSGCWLALGRRTFPLASGENILGRDPGAGVWLDSPKVSRRHARLVVNGATATIEDLSSKNGTFVRGARLSAPVGLAPGDKIRVGPFALVFRALTAARSTETAG